MAFLTISKLFAEFKFYFSYKQNKSDVCIYVYTDLTYFELSCP